MSLLRPDPLAPPSLRRKLIEAAAVTVLLAGVLAAVLPSLFAVLMDGEPNSVPGAVDHVDMAGTLWFHWWWGHALDRGLNPFFTDYLSYPHGESLWITSGNFVLFFLGYPLMKLFGLLGGYAVLVLLILLANGVSGYYLLREVGGRPVTAFLGSLLLSVNGFVLLEAHSGRLEQLALFWMFLFFRALVRLRRRGGWRPILSAALVLSLAAHGSWHYGILLAVALLVWLAGTLWVRSWTSARSTVAVGLLALLVTTPAVVTQIAAFDREYDQNMVALEQHVAESETRREILSNHSLDFHALYGLSQRNNSPFVAGVLWAGLLLAAVALLTGKRRTDTAHPKAYVRTWLALLVVAVVLALGPSLRVHPHHAGIPLPFALLADGAPLMGRFLWPHRFVVLVYLAATVLVVTGTERVLAGRSRWLWAAGCILPAILVGLQLWAAARRGGLPLITTHFEVPPVYAHLATLPDGAMLELPVCGQFPALPTDYVYQVVHHKKLCNGSIVGPWFLVPEHSRAVIRRYGCQTNGAFWANVDQIPQLHRGGLRYVVFRPDKAVRRRCLKPATVETMRRRLEQVLGPSRRFDGPTNDELFLVKPPADRRRP